jgi:FkbM family methyltransferase
VAKEIKYNTIRDLLHVIRGKIKALTNWQAASSSSSAYDATIIDIYHRIMERKPNYDELMHWNVFLGGGTSIAQVESTLKASYEYDQLRSRNDIVLVHLPSFKLFCRSSDLDVGRQIIQTQSFEPHIASVLKDVLMPGGVLVDLGANIGYFSLMAATLVGPTGKVISFEPNARNLGLFYASIVENDMKNIIVMPVAASYSSQIHRLQSFGSNGFLEAPTPGQMGVQYIQAVVLDEILLSVPRIDAFKMDIEGFEPFALRGMLKIIDKHKPVLVTEFSPWHIEHRCGLPPQEYLDHLAAIGYRLSIIESSGRVTPAKDPAAIMKFWSALQNDKMQLDLIARPS